MFHFPQRDESNERCVEISYVYVYCVFSYVYVYCVFSYVYI